MRIAAIHVYQRHLPVADGAYHMASASVTALDTTLVQIRTDTGLCGWGETCPLGPVYQPHHAKGARAALAELCPGLVGMDPLALESVRAAMDERLNGHEYAKAALDMALWDLAGRHYGARVCDLLGGARTERVPAYYATTVDTPQATARAAAAKADEGFSRLQIKVGGRAIATDIEALRAAHEAVGHRVRLAADANRGWTTGDAVLVSNACAALPMVLEQPCNTIDEITSIRGQLRHPIYLDESATDLPATLRAIGANSCDGLALKVTRAGGISVMRTLRDVCAARSLPHTCDDAWGGDLVAAACVHVAATVAPRRLEGVWIAGPHIGEHYDPVNGIASRNGAIEVPRGPGLGIDIDPQMMGAPIASHY
jgi:L-alanine-DL-glutamate epimerase-like enolase superfamily enzyme